MWFQLFSYRSPTETEFLAGFPPKIPHPHPIPAPPSTASPGGARLLKRWFGPTAVTEGAVLRRHLAQDKRRPELDALAAQMRSQE